MKKISMLAACFLGISLAAPLQAAIFKDMAGKPAGLDDYTGKGKWLIVMIWASDCHVCNKEAKNYNAFHLKHKDKDATVLGLSMDGQEKLAEAKKFIQQHGLVFPNIIGEPRDVAIRFTNLTGVEWAGTPTILVYSPAGELAVQQAGAVPIDIIEEFLAQQQKPQ
ncbi:MAG: TlpA family protein disulfide reductase [Gammaproteobacteria bacterium]|nr:TlpA family protein disulfide reductase [Gammaproteobacteria bacterium]MDH5651631.1 TlpA family protein disulfide reductase [Gammaproteobacteria bacterium]